MWRRLSIDGYIFETIQSVSQFSEAVTKFSKKVALKNFAKIQRKTSAAELFFKKVAGLRPTTLLKKKGSDTDFFLRILQNL